MFVIVILLTVMQRKSGKRSVYLFCISLEIFLRQPKQCFSALFTLSSHPVNQNVPAAALHANALFGILPSSVYGAAVTCCPSQRNLACSSSRESLIRSYLALDSVRLSSKI